MAAPANPSPASGPGALSKRTDGGPAQKLRTLPDAQYGEAATYMDLQRQAPLAQSTAPGQGQPSGGPQSGGAPSVIPLNAPTTRPGEPVTAGSNFGPGPGPEILGPQVTAAQMAYGTARDTIAALAQSQPDNTALSYLAAKVNQGRL